MSYPTWPPVVSGPGYPAKPWPFLSKPKRRNLTGLEIPVVRKTPTIFRKAKDMRNTV